MNRSHRKQREEKHHAKQPAERPASSIDNCTKYQGGGGCEPRSIEESVEFWDEFYRSMSASLWWIAAAMKLPAEQTEDAMQEVWLAAWRNRSRFRGEDAARRLRGWMRKVMRNKTVDALRRLRRGAVSLDALVVELPAPEVEQAEIDREQWRAWLAERLEGMAEDESLNGRLLVGRFRDERTNAELAAETGLSEKAVECRICRMIAELREKAAEDWLVAPRQDRMPQEKKLEKSEKVARDLGISNDLDSGGDERSGFEDQKGRHGRATRRGKRELCGKLPIR